MHRRWAWATSCSKHTPNIRCTCRGSMSKRCMTNTTRDNAPAFEIRFICVLVLCRRDFQTIFWRERFTTTTVISCVSGRFGQSDRIKKENASRFRTANYVPRASKSTDEEQTFAVSVESGQMCNRMKNEKRSMPLKQNCTISNANKISKNNNSNQR